MQPYNLILLIALAAALAAWGLSQFVLSFFHLDRQKIQDRLAGEWRNDMNNLMSRSILLEPQLRDLPQGLARSRLIQAIFRKLRYAYPDASFRRFLVICAAFGVAALALAVLATESILIGVPAAIGAACLPVMFIGRKSARRQRQIVGQLPEALDFLSRILRAGHSLSTGIQMMGDELPNPIGAEFRKCHDRHSLGQSLEESLREAAGRVNSSDFAFFVTAVLIQRQTGGDLAEVLKNISTMIRARMRLQDHVKAITAEGRLTGNVLVAFPIVLFAISYVLNPSYAGVLLRTQTGKLMLCAAGALQVIGLVLIRRIVSVKV